MYVFEMDLNKSAVIILALTSLVCSVKVNMQGSLSFGKDVLDTLKHYLNRNQLMQSNSRRTMTDEMGKDLYHIVKSTYPCREIAFCEGQFEIFLNEFITAQTKSVSITIGSLMSPEPAREKNRFENTLKSLIRDIKILLRNINMRVTKRTKTFYWMDLLKKVTAMFQEAAIIFATEKLVDDIEDKMTVKKILMQKFIISTVSIENEYRIRLCLEFNICTKSYECTKALSTFLGAFPNLKDEKVKTFMRYLGEALHESTFYSHLSEVTANEFQVILNDMGFSNTVPTKGVLATLQKVVDARLESLKENKRFVGAKDAELVFVILSDMDHFYINQNKEPFHHFLASFFAWTRSETKIRGKIYEVIANIAERLFQSPPELQVKLIHEVRAFFEITVDP